MAHTRPRPGRAERGAARPGHPGTRGHSPALLPELPPAAATDPAPAAHPATATATADHQAIGELSVFAPSSPPGWLPVTVPGGHDPGSSPPIQSAVSVGPGCASWTATAVALRAANRSARLDVPPQKKESTDESHQMAHPRPRPGRAERGAARHGHPGTRRHSPALLPELPPAAATDPAPAAHAATATAEQQAIGPTQREPLRGCASLFLVVVIPAPANRPRPRYQPARAAPPGPHRPSRRRL
jgi:hypothetical protein